MNKLKQLEWMECVLEHLNEAERTVFDRMASRRCVGGERLLAVCVRTRLRDILERGFEAEAELLDDLFPEENAQE